MRPWPAVAAAALLCAAAGAFALQYGKPAHPDALESLRACGQVAGSSRQECFNTAFSVLVTSKGPVALFTAYDALRREDPTVAYECHEAGHRAGAQYFRESSGVVDALDYVGGSCQSAFTHGVFDAWVDSGTADNTTLAQAASACDTAEDYHSRFLCFDGIGHVVYQTSASLEEAFARCNLSSYSDGLEGCASGVLMQKWAPVLPEDRDPSARLDDIVDLCQNLTGAWPAVASPIGSPVGDGTWRSACRRTANYPFSTVLGDLGGVTPESVREYINLCLAASDDSAQGVVDSDFCIETAGFPFLYHAEMNPQAAAPLCGLLPERNVAGCLYYLVRSDLLDGAASSPDRAVLERAAVAS